jgi:hypothetical protein
MYVIHRLLGLLLSQEAGLRRLPYLVYESNKEA